MRGFPKPSTVTILVVFPPTFHVTTDGDPFRTTSHQASTVRHEVCHYVRPSFEGRNRVTDFAYGTPAFQGVPANGGQHNYQQLTAEEAIHNAESYNLFAEHVTFDRDTRFGSKKDDLDAFLQR